MRYAFTGPSRLTSEERRTAQAFLGGLRPIPTEVTTGGADGFDTLAAFTALDLWPSARHRVVAPDGAAYNQGGVAALVALAALRGIRVEWDVAPPRRASPTAADRYRARNERMLDHADVLVAALLQGSDAFYRSGEWMTVNIARRRGIHVRALDLRDDLLKNPQIAETS